MRAEGSAGTTGRSFRRYLARIAPMIVVIAALGAEWARDRVPSAPSSSARKFLEVGYVEFFERYRIEPRAETKVPEVDFLGPDRQPPPDVESLRRTWLTWD